MTDRADEHRRTASLLPLFLLGQITGILLGRMAGAPWLAIAALAASLAAFCLLRKTARLAALVILACALGAVTGWYAYHPLRPEPATYTVRGIICDEVSPGSGEQMHTRLAAVTLDGCPIATDAYWSFYPDDTSEGLLPGCEVTFTGRVYAPMEMANPDDFSFNEYLLGQSIACAVYGRNDLTHGPASAFHLRGALASLRHTLLERLTAVMGEEAADYAAAMLLGVKQRVPQDDRDAFSRLGAAHLLVVSGFHVGVLASLMGRLLRSRGLRLRTALTTLVLLAYVLLVGGHTPVVRALLLYLMTSAGKLLKRPRPLLWALCGSAVVTLLFAPAQLTSASFQLTYAAVLGIAVITPWLKKLPRSLAYSLGAQCGVMLPVLYDFHELPLLGLLLNTALLPAASFLISLYWLVLVALPIRPLAQVLGMVAGWLTELMTSALHLLNDLPFVSLWTRAGNLLTLLAWLSMLFLLSPFLRLKRRFLPVVCLAVMLLSVMIPLPHTGTEYIQFAVGSADAALLWDENRTVVIDTGEDGHALSSYLHQRRLSIDTLILTHLHDDHALGIRALLEDRIPIGEVCLPWGGETMDLSAEALAMLEALKAAGVPIRHLARGDTLPLPSGDITVLWPERDKVRPGTDANHACLTLHVRVEGVSLLLTGDLSGERTHYIATPADVLKAPHHGSADYNRADFLAAVSPKAVLVSCGPQTNLTALHSLAGAVPCYDTNTHGAIMLRLDSGAFTIDTMRE